MKNLLSVIILTTILLHFSIPQCFAQTTFNTCAQSAMLNGYQFEYSIGELCLVTTDRSSSLIVTQGFLQPAKKITGSESQPTTGNQALFESPIKVYPNPVQHILFIEAGNYDEPVIAYRLLDATGKAVLISNKQLRGGQQKCTLDLESLAPGNYFLTVTKRNISGNEAKESFKIQKFN